MTQNSLNDDPSGATGFTVQRRLVLAWLALAWERLWVRLWVIGLLLGIFAIFVLLDVLPQLNWMVHTGVVLAAAAGIGFTVWQRLRGFSWPSREEARARLETTSPVEHRPLTTVEDTLVAGASAIQQWMWRLHQARAHADLDRLRVKAPSPGIASRDRFAVRSAVILALFVAVIGAWSDIGNRIGRGILPMLSSDVSKAAVKLWVTPPEYTRISPIYLESPTPEGTTPPSEIEVPAGSKVLTIVTGTGRDTALTFGSVSKPLEKLADESQRGEADIVDTDSIALKQGPRTIAEWNVKFVPDAPPSVSMSGPPGEAARWKTRIDYIVRDDYGAEKVTARITRADDAKTPPLTFDVELPPNASNIFAHSSLHDLAGHIWAGDEVKIELFATDFAKQTGTSAPMTATLPLRTFKHPASRELARWRKELYYKPDATAPQVLNSVKQVLSQPDVYGKEPLVTLALETAKYRLANDPPAQSAAMVSQLLWHTAVRIEDGKLMTAEQRLAAAQKALREAVARGASPEEIKARLDDLEDALAEYQNALDDGGKEREGFSTNAEKEELKKAMEDVKKMAELGSSDATKDALKKLEDKLNDMRNGGNSDSDNPEVKKAEEMLNKMQKLAEDQSKLLDKNFEKQKEEAAKKGENEQGSGYQRSLFDHWVDLDRDGCDTRAEVLTRDSSSLVQRDPYRCRVVEGDWYSVYDGWEETLPSEIDIDHVVALKEAWDSGAWDWSPTARRLFANDVTDPRTLRAVSDDSNRAKSDKDPSNWLPMSSFVCTYLGDWVSIKVRWNLSMDQSEFGRVRNLLTSECPGLRVPAPTAPPVDVPPAGSGGAADSVPTNDAGVGGGDVYFANCAAARAAGAAPLREGEPGYRTGLDRDRDGVACEG